MFLLRVSSGQVWQNDACWAYLAKDSLLLDQITMSGLLLTYFCHKFTNNQPTFTSTEPILFLNTLSFHCHILVSISWNRRASSRLNSKPWFCVPKRPVAKGDVYIFNSSRWFLHNTFSNKAWKLTVKGHKRSRSIF